MFEKVREVLGRPATAEDDVEPDPGVARTPETGGAAAGAVGTTAHDVVSGIDAVVRGKPSSDAPARLVGTLLGAAALGAASGARSTAGMAALAFTSRPDDDGRIASKLGSRAGR